MTGVPGLPPSIPHHGVQAGRWERGTKVLNQTGAIFNRLLLSEPSTMLGLFLLWWTFLRILLKVRRPLPTELVVPYVGILLPSLFWEVTQNYFFSPLESSYHLQFPVALDSAPLSHRPILNPSTYSLFTAPTHSGVWAHLAQLGSRCL